MPDVLTLQEAADELGVHYMTAYRYVRLGLLEAYKEGGAWRVDAEAIERFRQGEQQAPVERGDRAPWAERLESRLVAGDSQGAWGVVEASLASGADLDGVYLEVLTPALVSIGERWERGELDVALEHRASGIATRLIGRLGHRFSRRGRVRGAVVVGAAPGEQHALPTAMLSDLLRLRGWDVSDLGANVPADSFVHAVRAVDEPVACGLSVSSSENLDGAAAACAAIRGERADVRVVLGGRAVDGEDHATSLGAHAWAASGAAFHELLESWMAGGLPAAGA